VVNADAAKQLAIIEAEGVKNNTVTIASGELEKAKMQATAIEAIGTAKGLAENALLRAPVDAQIVLAKEIGDNSGYQTYLISVRGIEKDQAVGIEQAKALQAAEVKVIANTGTAVEGVKDVMDLFTSKGGTQIAATLEAINQSPTGQALVSKLTGKK